tara:strand:- start:307 stop:807 length:501 start_codon:yes stop_codon:yes gene_type:complete
MPKLVSKLDSVVAGIKTLNKHVSNNRELANRLGHAHAFYVLEEGSKSLFGFSKFVGYENMSPETYLRDYKQLDGRNTELRLSTWFEEVRYGSPAYEELRENLTDWLAQYGKRPREGKNQKVRLMVLRPEFRMLKGEPKEDRRLLDLMLAVADILPADQRHELRAAL